MFVQKNIILFYSVLLSDLNILFLGSNLLLHPWLAPPAAKKFSTVKKSRQSIKNIKSRGRSTTVKSQSITSIPKSVKASSKQDESFFDSVWNSFLKLFFVSDKNDKTKEKSSKSKNKKTTRPPVTKRQQIVRKKPAVSKQKKPTSVASKKQQLPSKQTTKPSRNQRLDMGQFIFLKKIWLTFFA